MSKLTKRTIDALPIKDTDYATWDSELRGFGIRVWPSGKKTYVLKCHVKGKQKKYSIGVHGVFTVDQARTNAIEYLSEAKQENDKSEKLKADRNAPTMGLSY